MLIVSNKYESLDRIISSEIVNESDYASRDTIKSILGDLIFDLNDGTPSKDGIHFFLKKDNDYTVNMSDQSYLVDELQPYLKSKKYKVLYYSGSKDTDGSVTPKNPTEGVLKISKGNKEYTLKYRVSGKNIYKSPSGKTDKSETRDLTAIKEYATLLAIKNNYKSENDIDQLTNDFNAWIESSPYSKYKNLKLVPSYLSSAIKASKCFYSNVNKFDPANYSFERQGEGQSSKIYKLAKKLTGIPLPDNWNPGDIWMFKNGYNLDDELSKCNSADDINSLIAREIKVRNIIPLSLKLVDTKSKPHFSHMNDKYIKDNFKLDQVSISQINFGNRDGTDIPNSFNLNLANGYSIHGHAKASSTTDICSYELQPSTKSKVQCGAIDKITIINKYLAGVQTEQRSLYDKDGIYIYKNYIEFIKNYGIKNNLSSKIKGICDKAMEDETDLVTKQRFCMAVVNVYYVLNRMNEDAGNGLTVLQKMFLSGLKADFGSGQSEHFKIY